MPSAKVRLFYALPVEDALRDDLASLSRDVAAECEGRPVPGGNLHATLAFLGDVQRALLPRLEAVGAGLRRAPPGGHDDATAAERVAASAAPLDLTLDRVGTFERARVAYVAPSQVPPDLRALHRELVHALAAHGFRLETRPYRPHVTLARHCRRTLGEHAVAARDWRPQRVALYESVTAPEGARYEVIASWPLVEASARRPP